MNLTALLRQQLRASDYNDITDFARRSGVPVSLETVRRCIGEGKPVNHYTFLLIMKYLDFSADEIKEALIAQGDKEISSLIGEQQGATLSQQEQALVEIYRVIKSQDMLVSHLEILARADGVNISKHIKKFRGR